ncbi:hydroxyisourate hydrolase [Streptomyces cinnamoneus]|uniref:5-hydroxyisourate hydrolase n=1 Tax=Streptomyces cinnamoneus TaxID=53446 RepID=A0A2G1XA20_STRCJ|nr:hydroxyisourate hydrolase [Streptomyces cinnamoneus]PHQ48084.1 hydroxyisourate hydrolase [Streptomyces cinnamoneus]PPT15710.1 hydroxyisourate hydrolase [Streptomyces cinnamoneus]
MSTEPAVAAGAASVSTHLLDTAAGRPAAGVAVELSAAADDGEWTVLGAARTDADGRCTGLPALPGRAARARLRFDVEPYLSRRPQGAAFFPEVTVTFAVAAGEHHHVPLLLSPFGYSVYRGS